MACQQPALQQMKRIDEKSMALVVDWVGQDVSLWWWTEKYDGCRAYWDGENLWTRGGNIINAPADFLATLPKGVHLDGEIWCGYGRFQEARVAVQHGKWNEDIRFVVFDAPKVEGCWRLRMSVARQLALASGISFVTYGMVGDIEDALDRMREVQARGGEGIILHDPDSERYEIGRTGHLLRLKYEPYDD